MSNDESCDLRTLEAISLKVVEASPDAKIVINDRGVIVVFNVQAELMFGYDRAEVLGKSMEVLLPESVRDVHKGHRASYFKEARTREMGPGMVLQGRYRDGTTFPVQIKLAPLIVTGVGVHALAVVRRVKEETTK